MSTVFHKSAGGRLFTQFSFYLSFLLSLVFSLICTFLIFSSFSFLLFLKFWSGTNFVSLDLIYYFSKTILLLYQEDSVAAEYWLPLLPRQPERYTKYCGYWVETEERIHFQKKVKKIYKANRIYPKNTSNREF